MLKGNEIRKLYLDYFKDKHQHTIVESSSLVPDNPTVLLTTAGMLQFLPIFLNIQPCPYEPARATSCQKCARAGGKDSDIENVGRTPRHHTFFEMLGNFSFGDYYKKEVIPWAWEFVTEVLKLDKNRLWITIYETDDEAYEIWRSIGVPPERIKRKGKKDNFWGPPGASGSCGPCSEIHYDLGEEYSCSHPNCGIDTCECDRWVEIWNLVFTELFQDEEGNQSPLEKKNVDTGMGLERITMVCQGVASTFETDLLKPILDKVSKMSGVPYKKSEKTDVSLRIITDHARCVSFLISDGVIPGNEGRSYVLRMILRRALRHGKILGMELPFLHKLVDVVVENYGEAYPELIKNNFKNKLKKIPTKEELSPLYKEEKEKKINQSSIKHKFITNEILKCGDTKDKFEIKKDMKTLIEEKFRVYRQGGQIEDSYNESESDEEGEPDNFLINPETNIFFIYDTIIVFIAVYSLAAISYQITGDCFCQENHNNLKFFFELISDIIFLIDLIINFFLEYYTETNKLIKNRKKIIKNYLRGWFFFDFLSALPMNIIYYYYCKIYEFPICHTYERNGLVSALLLLKCLKTIKIFKIPVTKKNQFISYLAELASDETTENVNLTIELLLVIFGLHILSCIHIFIGKHTYPGWIYANNFQDYSVLNLYMISVYYLITTMTTVGYGDISSVIYRNHFSHYTSSSRYYLLLLAN